MGFTRVIVLSQAAPPVQTMKEYSECRGSVYYV